MSGHPVLDFVNTGVFSEEEPATDVLRSTHDFLAWSAREGLSDANREQAVDRAFLRDAIRLRDSMRTGFEAVARGRRPDPDDLVPLQQTGAEALRHATPTFDDARLTWEWKTTNPNAVVWRLATAAIDLLRETQRGRIKTCPGCGFLLLDATKNARRRWCSMDDCGTQEKMRRYVAKRAGKTQV